LMTRLVVEMIYNSLESACPLLKIRARHSDDIHVVVLYALSASKPARTGNT
jgi:hypothetical protein